MWDKSGFMFDRTIDGPWYADHTGWSWVMGLHGGFWLLIIALIVATLVLALRLGTHDVRSKEGVSDSSARRRCNSARNILDERYARGEIGRADYIGNRQKLS